ncbi:MAG: hypothetical protein GC151_00975 [Betaproteobacteria bacterium]|nr:hypothetical protein [Betaproteobacteria bacterium]
MLFRSRMTAGAALALAAGCATVPGHAHALDATFSAGEGDRVRMLSAGVAFPLVERIPCTRFCEASFVLVTHVARWWLPYDGGYGSSLWDGSLVPSVRVAAPAANGSIVRVEAGIGGHYLSRRDLGRQRFFGSNWQFGEFFQAGFSLSAQSSDAWFLRIEHVSNGGFASRNSGVTFFGITYRRHLAW